MGSWHTEWWPSTQVNSLTTKTSFSKTIMLKKLRCRCYRSKLNSGKFFSRRLILYFLCLLALIHEWKIENQARFKIFYLNLILTCNTHRAVVPVAGVTCSTVCLHKGQLMVPFLPILKFNWRKHGSQKTWSQEHLNGS